MTLVLSEVSHWGIAMAADSAVTFSSGRVYVGAQKLQPVPQIDAGMSVWGLGCVGNEDADIWLQQFIQKEVSANMSLWSVAERLADKLNEAFGRTAPDRMGVHVCGYDEHNGVRGPALYHVHNGHYEVEIENGKFAFVPKEPKGQPPIREFKAHDDIRPQAWSQSRRPEMRRNGDICVFGWLNTYLARFFDDFQQSTDFRFPYPDDLSSRGEYLRFWINMVIELYRLSNARPRIFPQPATAGDASIGGPVTVLTISENGLYSFYTK